MSHFKCSVPGCERYAVLNQPYCALCGRFHCFDHIEDADAHPCHGSGLKPMLPRRSFQDEYGPTIAKFDLPTIVAQAESLRPGHTCKGPGKLVIGDRGHINFIAHGTNIHFPVEFDDGKKWMVRARKLSKISPPFEISKAGVLSEAATFNRLHEAGVKVPQAWLPSEWTNEALYYFVDFVEGAYHPPLLQDVPEEPDELTKTIIRNLAEFHISLEKVSYDSVGSLTSIDNGSTIVGPVIGMDMISPVPPFLLGPFKSAKDHYLTLIDHLLGLVMRDAYCAPSQSLPTYLALLEARSLVQDCKDMEEGPAYICHAEPKGDHVLVDEHGGITAVIDWEWSYLSCKAEAFAAPWCLLGESFYDGDNDLSIKQEFLRDTYIELGRPHLARFVEGSHKWLRLGDDLSGTTDFEWLIATRQAFGQGGTKATQNVPDNESEWRREVTARHAGDETLQKLLRKHA